MLNDALQWGLIAGLVSTNILLVFSIRDLRRTLYTVHDRFCTHVINHDARHTR